MEKLKKAFEKTDASKRKQIAMKIGIAQNSSASAILNTLTTITGLNTLLRSLNEEELQVFSALAAHTNGLTYSEIEKELRIKISDIELISEHLKDLLLVYLFKNRKHLNNRFDKVYLHSPIQEIITEKRTESLDTILTKVSERSISKSSAFKLNDKNAILETVFNLGGIISLDKLSELFPEVKIDALLLALEEAELIRISFELQFPFCTVISLTTKSIDFFIQKKSDSEKNATIKNNFSMVLNILHAYDVISSNGLFLTQQNNFRKTDVKKIQQRLISVTDLSGQLLSLDDIFQQTIFFMNVLGLLELTKLNVFTHLEPIKKNLTNPSKILDLLLKNFAADIEDENLLPSIDLPYKKHVEYILKKIKKSTSINLFHLKNCFVFDHFAKQKESHKLLDENIAKLLIGFDATLRFLILLGVINRNGADIELSECSYPPKAGQEYNETIYLNPDFSMIIPKNETPPYAQYLVLAYSTIVKDDITVNAKISKESVLDAYKRGMKTKTLIDTLDIHAHNKLPQNMSFLINEWIKQTLSVTINYGILIEVNHPTFLDELEFKCEECLVRRISETSAIVKEERIDDIIKMSEKHKALISIDIAK